MPQVQRGVKVPLYQPLPEGGRVHGVHRHGDAGLPVLLLQQHGQPLAGVAGGRRQDAEGQGASIPLAHAAGGGPAPPQAIQRTGGRRRVVVDLSHPRIGGGVTPRHGAHRHLSQRVQRVGHHGGAVDRLGERHAQRPVVKGRAPMAQQQHAVVQRAVIHRLERGVPLHLAGQLAA